MILRAGLPRQTSKGASVSLLQKTMPAHDRDLTDTQWLILDPLIPKPTRRRDGRGRPWTDRRSVLNAILWVLRTGAPWADVPDRYPSYQTCHRRFQQWVRSGIMKGLLESLALEAIEQLRRTVDLDQNYPVTYWILGLVLRKTGCYELAITEGEKGVKLSGGSPLMRAALAHTLGTAGRTKEA